MDMCIGICMDMCIDTCMDMCIDRCMDICMDICMDMCMDMWIDRRLDMCTGMCIDMCMDISMHGTVKCSKIRRIDARQDWVQAMRDSAICKLCKVHTLENESDLLAKIHEPDQFERLRNRCMVFQKLPTEQHNGTDAGSNPKCGTDG